MPIAFGEASKVKIEILKKGKYSKCYKLTTLYFIYEDEVYSGQYILSTLLSRGIKADALVWDTDAIHWRRADEVEELKEYFSEKKAEGKSDKA